MTQLLAVFRSRTQATDCANQLKWATNVKLINTPPQAGVGCGLSVAFWQKDLPLVKAVITRNHYQSFYGFLTLNN